MGSPEAPVLSLRDLNVDPSSYVDPNGFVFRHRGVIYRAIYTDVAAFYRGLADDGTYDALTAHHHLVPTAVADLDLHEPTIGLVLRHEAIEPITYCVEWCPSMLREAGCALLDLALAVLDRDCILQDCYPWNVVFRGTKPIVVDVTSIARVDTSLMWPAFEQYQAFFLRPLQLAAMGKGGVARAMLWNHITGVSIDDFYRNAGAGYRWRHPSLPIGYHLDRMVQRNPTLKRKLRQSVAASKTTISRPVRDRFLRGRLSALRGVPLARHTADVWSGYYAEIAPEVDKDAKVTAVRELIGKLAPATVLDAGCNTGVFSMVAARAGARVVALDSSEACIERLYAAAKSDDLVITPLVVDLFCPTPPGGWMARQYPGLIERVRSDLVLCLGLMHHLHITGRQSFARIAGLMDALSSRHLIFEYVAQDDDNNVLLGAGRPIRYDLDLVVAALKTHFPSIEVLDSDRPTRRLLVCAKDR